MEASTWAKQRWIAKPLTTEDWQTLEAIFPNVATRQRHLIEILRKELENPAHERRWEFPKWGQFAHAKDSVNTVLRLGNHPYRISKLCRGGKSQILALAQQPSANITKGFELVGSGCIPQPGFVVIELHAPMSTLGIDEIGRLMDFEDRDVIAHLSWRPGQHELVIRILGM